MKKLLRNKKGFTLIELIVVIAILAILAAILIPSLLNYMKAANKAQAESNARTKLTENALLKATSATYAQSGTAENADWSCAWNLDATTITCTAK